MAIDDIVFKRKLSLGDRILRLKGTVSETSKRIDDLRADIRNNISELRREIRDLRGKFWWIIGILIPMWITTVLAVLFS